MGASARRSRVWYTLATLVVIGLGLLSRSDMAGLPWKVAKYAGDILWGVVVFVGLGLVFPSLSTRVVVGLSVAFACGVEASQLVHPEWLDELRRTKLGGLVLGTPESMFAWLDIVAYLLGIAAGGMCECSLRRRTIIRPT